MGLLGFCGVGLWKGRGKWLGLWQWDGRDVAAGEGCGSFSKEHFNGVR